MRKTSWRIAQAVAGIIIIVVLVRNFLASWNKVHEQPVQWSFRWEYIFAAMVVTWAMYGVLIWGWRTVLQGWREWLKIVDAARIWTISSLGQFIPGKVWSIAGMAVMSQERGVSAVAATGSAVIMQLVNLATGAVLALALTGATVLDDVLGAYASLAAIALAIVALLSALALTSPSLTRRIGFLLGRPDAIRPVDPGALAAAVFANLVAWAGYGVALQLVLLGTMRGSELSWSTATGAFAVSYVAGFLALLLPGGLGVRELLIAILLTDSIGIERATALALVSRIVMTVNQVGAAVPFLLFRRKPSEAIRPA